jgi:hypothetical protein
MNGVFDFGESTRPEHAHNPLRRALSCDDLSVRAVNDGSLNWQVHHQSGHNDNYMDLMLENADWKRHTSTNFFPPPQANTQQRLTPTSQTTTTRNSSTSIEIPRKQSSSFVNSFNKNAVQTRNHSKPKENQPRSQEETSFLYKKLCEEFGSED